MRARLRADLLAAAVAVIVAVVFWMQRDYRERLAVIFPDFVLAGLVVLAALLLLRTVLARATGVFRGTPPAGFADDIAGEPGEEPPSGERAPKLAMVVASMALLGAWVALLTPLGFTLSGILGYLAVTVFVRRGSFRPRHLLVDVPVAVAVVWGCFLIFTRVLLVPLPVPPFIYG